MKDKVTAEPATAKDIIEFYGESHRQTLKADVFRLDGELMGVTGTARVDNQMMMFSDIKEEFVPHLKSMAVLRTIKKMQRIAENSRLPVVATIDNKYGPELIERMGFKHVEGDIYVWVH